MSFAALCWVFTLGALLHNLEEALFLPKWSMQAGNWFRPVGPRAFRFAVGVLSGLFVVVTALGAASRPLQPGAYAMAGYALAVVLNAFFPHLLITVVRKRYMPGTATALFCNVPLGSLLLYRAFTENRIQEQVFLWVGPLETLILLGLIPILLTVGRYLGRVIGPDYLN